MRIDSDHIKVHFGKTGKDPESYIEVNGQRLKLVKSVDVHIEADDISRVTITMLTTNLDVEGDAFEIGGVTNKDTKRVRRGDVIRVNTEDKPPIGDLSHYDGIVLRVINEYDTYIDAGQKDENGRTTFCLVIPHGYYTVLER